MKECVDHIIHIDGLQMALAKRNQEISRLKSKINQLENPPASDAEVRGFKAGYQKAMVDMKSWSIEVASSLGKLGKAANDEYLQTLRNEGASNE